MSLFHTKRDKMHQREARRRANCHRCIACAAESVITPAGLCADCEARLPQPPTIHDLAAQLAAKWGAK